MTTNEQAPILQLRIDLKHIRPPVWRRVLVPADVTLDNLHDIIQAVMPWWDAHLHEFTCGGVTYGRPMDDEWYETEDSRMVTLSEVLPKVGDTIDYQYDFGDSWEHKIRLEKMLDPDPNIAYPVCTKGKRACPPEDCGGVPGYMYMLEVLKDPKNDEYEAYVEWMGDDVDPEVFDIEEANEALQDLSPQGLSSASPGIQPVNRVALILSPKEAMYEWVRTLPESLEITPDEVRQASVVLLIPILDTEDEFFDYLADSTPEWIAMMLSIWEENRNLWPPDFEEIDFDAWFDVDVHNMVVDTGLDAEMAELMNSGLGEMFSSILGSMDDDDLGNLLGLN